MSDDETNEARDTRRREEDFYDWVEGKDQDSNYVDKKESMRDHADKNEYYHDHFDRYETKKEYEERKLEEYRGRK
jgi:hypothetical protein